MNNTKKISYWTIPFYVIPLIGLGLAIFNSYLPYSFWADELGSVSMSILPLKEVIASIIVDVHPPLFQLFLKGWVWIFGSDEPTVRLLSLLSCLIALIYLFFKTKIFNVYAQWATISIFTTCFLFSFYSQEARSYALTLLFSTILTIKFINFNKSKSVLPCLILILTAIGLSLIHYFGLLLSLSILSILLIQYRKCKKQTAYFATGILLLMVWPVAHYVLGLAKLKSSRNAWMVVDGPLDTGRIFLRTFFPNFNDLFLIFCASCLCLIIAFTINVAKKIDGTNLISCSLYRLTALLLIMIFGIACADIITPISTERNFIVLLPAVSLVVGVCIELLIFKSHKIGSSIVVIATMMWSLNSLYFAQYLMHLKWMPQQNWKSTAQYVVNNYKSQSLYYLRNSDEEETERVFNFYVNKLSNGSLSLERIYIEQVSEIPTNSFLVLGGANPSVFEQVKTRSNRQGLKVFQPVQSLGWTTGMIEF